MTETKMDPEVKNSYPAPQAQALPELDSEPLGSRIDPKANRFPFCIVWTPIPFLTWLFPFIGHMGICTSVGIIRDFAGPYYVGQNHMAFGRPTRFLPMDPSKATGDSEGWDKGVSEASEIYSQRIHNLFCDNCHSHVAKALDIMNYEGRSNWNMFVLCFRVFFRAKFVGVSGFLKTFLPWMLMTSLIIILIVLSVLL